MEHHTISKRADAEQQFTWATEDLFADDQLWKEELDALKAVPAQIAAYQGRLGESAATLLEYLTTYDAISLRLERLYMYAHLKGDEDTGNSVYQNMRGQAISLLVACQSAGAFETPELLAIPEDILARFYREQPELMTYRRRLYKIRRQKEHILTAPEEALLAASGEMANAPDNIGSTFRNADMKFPPAADENGSTHPLTMGSYIPLMESPDRKLRSSAFENLFGTFKNYRNAFAAMLDGQMKQLLFYTRARKYGSTLEASLDNTEVPTAVYHNLIRTVHENMDKMYRYVELRKRLMGLDELHFYDLYTPIVSGVDLKIPFEDAKKAALEALSVLGEDYTALLQEGFSHRWIDVYENEGKRSGAYSSGGRPHPYVLLNHKDTLDSMFTLVHEMGHALHSYLSVKNQPQVNSEYVIFVAEVASTCNEVLLTQHLLKNTTDKKQRAYIINHFLEQFRGTVYRQTMFAEYELFMGQTTESGESLTADLLTEKYYALCKEYFGPDIVADELIGMEWARIPHFFYNYYVFQYATGFAAAIAIAMRILREGAPAVADYKKFLGSGGSDDPISLLKIAGVDMMSPAPINDALKMFGELLDEMEELMK